MQTWLICDLRLSCFFNCLVAVRSDAAEDQLKAAECYIKLGELSMETGLYPCHHSDESMVML